MTSEQIYKRRYYQKNKERLNAYNRAYYQSHKEYFKEYNKEYYEKHKKALIRKAESEAKELTEGGNEK